jgi:hypothetical protein
MLRELSRYENLGTPGFFWEMLQRLRESDTRWTPDDLTAYFFNRIVDGEAVFDGCLPMAKAIGIIRSDERSVLGIDSEFLDFLASESYMRAKTLERILVAFGNDDEFLAIFSPLYLSYDIVYSLIQIDSSAFGFRYANLRRFLTSFGFISPHPDKKIRKFIINPKHRRLFDMRLLAEVKRRKIGIDNLEATLEQKRIAGANAEEFVVVFEKRRVVTHPKLESIQRISDYDVAAGYDVVSYDGPDSVAFDRFIEVKSCTIDRRFFWSKNEILQAKIKRAQYFLYLVNPEKIRDAAYEPMIIQDPYENVFQDQSWAREAQSWLFSKDQKRR